MSEDCKKNILIVDDSALMRRFISDIITSDGRFRVKDLAKNGRDALELIAENNYDTVIMDINMPVMDGIETLKRIQQNRYNAKVIVVSTLTEEDAKETIEALEYGALECIKKPSSYSEVKGEGFRQGLLRAVSVACGCMESITPKQEKKAIQVSKKPEARHSTNQVRKNNIAKSGLKIVALACSTGGPKSLKEVIPYIPSSLDAPVVMVQHMPASFTKSLADRLNDISNVNVKEAEDGDVLKKGWVYLAPGGKHMRIKNDVGDVHSVVLSDEPAIDGLRPCANIMYESLCDTAYDKVICVVLTGMGADGTKGIEALGKEKNVYVIAQNEASSVVYGMPKAVAAAGLADEVKPLNQIAEAIIKNTGVLRDGR